MIDMLRYHLKLRIKIKKECLFLMYRLFVKIINLTLLPTIDQLLAEFIHILPAFYHRTISSILSRDSFIDAFGYAQVGLNYRLN